jgi:hypothetical protein
VGLRMRMHERDFQAPHWLGALTSSPPSIYPTTMLRRLDLNNFRRIKLHRAQLR